MKRQLLLLLLNLSIFATIYSQNVYIPDLSFKQRLIIEGIDLNNDSEISYAEAAVVNYLDITPEWGIYIIEDITGIEAFTNLDTLICASNSITILDSIKQLPLTYLDCNSNLITSLDFTQTELEYLSCEENPFMQLNASLFPSLKILKCNPSDSLKIDNPILVELYVTSHIYINTILAPELKKLVCRANSSPDLSSNPNLEFLHIESAIGQIENINLTENTNLEYLYVWSNLTSIDLSNNLELTFLSLFQNNLTSLDLSNNVILETLVCFNNELSSLDLSNNPELIYISCSQNNLTSLNISNLSNLQTLKCGHNQLTEINLYDNTSLEYLHIIYNQLDNLDLTMNTDLMYLYCSHNGMTGPLDLSQNTALFKIDCSVNELQILDLSNNIDLHEVWCQENNITDLNVYNLAYLHDLHFFMNDLEQIDLSANESLSFMQCGHNPIDSMDLSYNSNLNLVHFSQMPSLTKVCVSELPVPFYHTTSGSPNIIFEVCSLNDIQHYSQYNHSIYSNPTTGKIIIENNIDQNSLVYIYNLNGELVFETNFNEGNQCIDISFASKGMYFLKIVNDQNSIIRKIIKK